MPEITRISLSVSPSTKIILKHWPQTVRARRLPVQMIAERAVLYLQAALSMMIMPALFTNLRLYLSLSNKRWRM
jgi:hypothetical protein